MRILTVDNQGGGVGYYRFVIPRRALQALGHEVRVVDCDNYHDSLSLQCNSIHVIHSGYWTNAGAVSLLAAAREFANVPLLTEIDDDVLNVPTYNVAYKYYHGGAQERKIARMQLRISDGVSVSTKELQAVLQRDVKTSAVLPNCIDPTDWNWPHDPVRMNDKSVRFLFAGNLGRYGDLEEIKAPMTWAMRKFPQLRLFFVGCTPDWALEWMPSRTKPSANRVFSISAMNVKNYFAVLQWLAPDVVFAPVQKNDFNKSKSHIKAYDAAMTDAAFLCTDWPTYSAVPNDCAIKIDNTETQWKESIEALITDPTLRTRLNNRLKTWALDEWHIDCHIEKWVNFYEKAIAKGPLKSLEEIVRPGV